MRVKSFGDREDLSFRMGLVSKYWRGFRSSEMFEERLRNEVHGFLPTLLEERGVSREVAGTNPIGYKFSWSPRGGVQHEVRPPVCLCMPHAFVNACARRVQVWLSVCVCLSFCLSICLSVCLRSRRIVAVLLTHRLD